MSPRHRIVWPVGALSGPPSATIQDNCWPAGRTMESPAGPVELLEIAVGKECPRLPPLETCGRSGHAPPLLVHRPVFDLMKSFKFKRSKLIQIVSRLELPTTPSPHKHTHTLCFLKSKLVELGAIPSGSGKNRNCRRLC